MTTNELLIRYAKAMLSYEQEVERHRETIGLIRRMQDGELTLDHVHIQGDAWRTGPPATPDGPVNRLQGSNGEVYEVVEDAEGN